MATFSNSFISIVESLWRWSPIPFSEREILGEIYYTGNLNFLSGLGMLQLSFEDDVMFVPSIASSIFGYLNAQYSYTGAYNESETLVTPVSLHPVVVSSYVNCKTVDSAFKYFSRALDFRGLSIHGKEDYAYFGMRGIVTNAKRHPYFMAGFNIVPYYKQPIGAVLKVDSNLIMNLTDPMSKFVLRRLVPCVLQEVRTLFSRATYGVLPVTVKYEDLSKYIIYPRVPENPPEDSEKAASFLFDHIDDVINLYST